MVFDFTPEQLDITNLTREVMIEVLEWQDYLNEESKADPEATIKIVDST